MFLRVRHPTLSPLLFALFCRHKQPVLPQPVRLLPKLLLPVLLLPPRLLFALPVLPFALLLPFLLPLLLSKPFLQSNQAVRHFANPRFEQFPVPAVQLQNFPEYEGSASLSQPLPVHIRLFFHHAAHK